MLGFVPQPNLPNLLQNSADQRVAETQQDSCLFLGYKSDKFRYGRRPVHFTGEESANRTQTNDGTGGLPRV